MDSILNLLNAAIPAGTPLLLGMLGETLTEKSGNLNLGVEGMMFMGAVTGFAGAWYYEQWMAAAGLVPSGIMAILAALLASFLAGSFGAVIYSILTITLRANQNVAGLTLTIFGTGFGNFFGELLGQRAGDFATVSRITKDAFGKLNLGALSNLPVVGKLFFNYNWMVYFAVALAILMGWFLNRTRVGLNLRAVGENPATADAVGINVARYRYVATIVGGGISGIGGMYMVMVTCGGTWVHNCVSGYGWLAVALVIFGTWSPLRGLVCALIFGGLSVMRMYIPITSLPSQIYDMFPYLATILVLIFTSIRQIREHSQPKSCGLNYFREER